PRPTLSPYTTLFRSLGNNRHELLTHPSRLALHTDVFQFHVRMARDTFSTTSTDCPVSFLRRHLSRIMPDGEFDSAVDDSGNYVGFLALLLPQPPRPHQRHLDPASRVRARDSTCPDPGDHRRFSSVLQRGRRVEVTDPLLSLVSHPLAVTPNILGEALGSRPPERVRLGVRMDR